MEGGWHGKAEVREGNEWTGLFHLVVAPQLEALQAWGAIFLTAARAVLAGIFVVVGERRRRPSNFVSVKK